VEHSIVLARRREDRPTAQFKQSAMPTWLLYEPGVQGKQNASPVTF